LAYNGSREEAEGDHGAELHHDAEKNLTLHEMHAVRATDKRDGFYPSNASFSHTVTPIKFRPLGSGIWRRRKLMRSRSTQDRAIARDV
jgi:hypothetical protein